MPQQETGGAFASTQHASSGRGTERDMLHLQPRPCLAVEPQFIQQQSLVADAPFDQTQMETQFQILQSKAILERCAGLAACRSKACILVRLGNAWPHVLYEVAHFGNGSRCYLTATSTISRKQSARPIRPLPRGSSCVCKSWLSKAQRRSDV
jgi:hypothetical protein